jgi:undecaprenyl diphosphate synthase
MDDLLSRIDCNRIPRHIAIIMDGNGRWANQRDLPRIDGHRQGAETVRRITRCCRKLGVEALTLYAFSDENWQRPKTEVAQLMELLAKFLVSERDEMRDNQISLRILGAFERLPDFVQKLMKEALEYTAGSHKMTLNLALSYGARNEILRAVRKAVAAVKAGKLRDDQIDADTFANFLDTAGLPDPDLMIRTSGEFRISNFLLWQLAYTEIHVTPVLWPDFMDEDLYWAILDFQSRERRFGLTGEQLKTATF